MVADFVYLGSLVRSTAHSSPDISCHYSYDCAESRQSDLEVKVNNFHVNQVEALSTCILPIFLYRDLLKTDDLNQWRLRELLGIKWYQHVRNNEVRWTIRQPLFWLLSKHGVSPGSAALPECQMKQTQEPRRSQQLHLDNRRRLPGNPRTTWMKT